jgi:transcriptional regulator, LysR family
MNLLQLKYFLTVARCEHMTRAAEELHIAQPSLSKVISKLEEELGVLLFERVGRQIKLNHFGKAFLNRVERVFLELDNGKRELSDMSINESSYISIAANNIGPFFILLERIFKTLSQL